MPHLTQTPAELAQRTIVLRPVYLPHSQFQAQSQSQSLLRGLIYNLKAGLRVQLLEFLFKNNTQKSVKNNQMRAKDQGAYRQSSGPNYILHFEKKK